MTLLPAYLAEDCQLVSVTGHRRLRSSDTDTCLVQRTNTRFGDRSFAVAGPRVWNSLQPTKLRESDIKGTKVKDRVRHYIRTISTSTQNASIWSLTAAAPSDSVFRALCINWLICLLTYLLTLLSTTALTFHERLLCFLYLWKQERILYCLVT